MNENGPEAAVERTLEGTILGNQVGFDRNQVWGGSVRALLLDASHEMAGVDPATDTLALAKYQSVIMNLVENAWRGNDLMNRFDPVDEVISSLEVQFRFQKETILEPRQDFEGLVGV